MPKCTIDLITEKPQRIAMQGIRVQSRIAGMGQRTTVEQVFVNLEDEAIEVTYTFPLPEQAAVCGFEVITGDRTLTGQVEETTNASKMYQEAIQKGDAAYAMHQHRPDVFSINVGNLKPGQAALVRITFVSELEVVDGRIRLAYPTVVAPRYATATATDPDQAQRDAEALNPPHLLSVPYGLTLEAEIDLKHPVRSVQSPSHQITVLAGEDHRYTVTLTAGMTATDREIVLDLDLGQESQPRADVVVGPDGNTYAAITFVPEFEEAGEPEPTEVVFVVDCSGSMEGSSINQARQALDLCLRNLSEGDLFNICVFGSTFAFMSPEPLPYSQQTLEHAVGYVHGIDANLGGTELHAPLRKCLERRPATGRTRQVIVMTDGQVTNEPAIIRLAREYAKYNRVFSFGIGPASSRYLVRSLASATCGAAEFISEGERIDEKVLRTFSRLAMPSLTDVSLVWDRPDGVELASDDAPPVFDGDALTVYARFSRHSAPSTLTLKSRAQAVSCSWGMQIGTPSCEDEMLPLLWARRRIEYLEHSSRRSSDHRSELVTLSRQFSLLCPDTVFIAIEHRSPEERSRGCPGIRRIPVQIPVGWHGIDMADAVAVSSISEQRFCCSRRSSDTSALMFRLDLPDGFEVPEHDAAPLRHTTGLGRLLHAQQADGSFDELNAAEFPRQAELYQQAKAWLAGRTLAAGVQTDRITNTVAAVLMLRCEFAAEEHTWHRAAQKARRYLEKSLGCKRAEVEIELEKLVGAG